MSKLAKEIKHDAQFLKSHTLQPQWWKVTKVFLLLGVIAGYWFFFGAAKTAVFVGLFMLLMLIVHLVYRVNTDIWTKSWLDFVVNDDIGRTKPSRIGVYYYTAVVISATVGVIVSQLLL